MINKTLTNELEQFFWVQRHGIEEWFAAQWSKVTPNLYCSVDLRDGSFKLAPVDVNIFPAGFNNLALAAQQVGAKSFATSMQTLAPSARKILLIPERHTRNKYYHKNIVVLCEILAQAGFEIKLGEELRLGTNKTLQDGDFIPDVVMLNADFAQGMPEILQDIRQPILPSPLLGWWKRSKYCYFQNYHKVCENFAAHFSIDSWLVYPQSALCSNVDFMDKINMDEVTEKAVGIFAATEKKYKEYKIGQKPFVIIKADYGSYGMAVTSVDDVAAIANLNRKQRTHMSTTKGARKVDRVLVQEGIPTINRVDQMTAEAVMYLVGADVIGGFYRLNENKNERQNLNAPGMKFADLQLLPPQLYAYGVVARLAHLAVSYELENYISIAF